MLCAAVTTISMLLPLTFKMSALSSIIMLSGIYYGAHHAGSTTAIMLNMPGEPTSVVICLDGYPMARQGRAGSALCISALGSFFAGCVGVLVIAAFSPSLAAVALRFGPAEYTSLIVLALIAVSVVNAGSTLISIAMAVLGLLLGTVGTDISSAQQRFVFGIPNITDGISFVALAVGLFAFSHIIGELNRDVAVRNVATTTPRLLPSAEDLWAAWKPILRGTALGAAIGIFPGTGPLVASFVAYSLERRIARDPSRFGNGAVEGVAGPESANNAAAFTHFIPMLTLGIPAGAAMALMLAALQIQGIGAGPEMMSKHADLFWGVMASMLMGNLMLLVLNLPLVGIWIRLLAVPYRFLYPVVLVCCCIGTYSVSNSSADVVLAAGAALVGFVFARLDCRPAPLMLGFILEPTLEENFRRALILSGGHATVFVTRPISLAIVLAAVAMLVAFSVPALTRKAKSML